MTRVFALLFAYIFLALAVIGIFIPGLPTVPFLLLAAWCAARGSEKLHRWLYAHPVLGKLLSDWEQHKAISRKSKITAVTMLIVSAAIIYFQVENRWFFVAALVFFTGVASYLVTRPEPK